MRKEVTFAIIAGIAAGLFLAFGIWKISSKVTEVVTSPKPSNLKNQSPTPLPSFSIKIKSPKNQSVVTEEKVSIEGNTSPNSWVVVSTIEDDYIAKSETTGLFTNPISVSGGFNSLNISAFDQNGQQINTSLDLVYSSEFSKYQSGSSATNPIYYTGTITDINGDALQIKSDKGGILQLTLGSDASFVKTKKPQNTTESIKATDLAIGDYVIALGYPIGSSTVLDTKRVIVTSPGIKNENVTIFGTITDVDKKTITISKTDAETLEIKFPKTWNGPDVSDLETDQKIIVTGTLGDDKSFNLRSILELND